MRQELARLGVDFLRTKLADRGAVAATALQSVPHWARQHCRKARRAGPSGLRGSVACDGTVSQRRPARVRYKHGGERHASEERRQNGHFMGHPNVYWRGSVIYSFLITVRGYRLDSAAWLSVALHRIPPCTQPSWSEPLPWNCKPRATVSDGVEGTRWPLGLQMPTRNPELWFHGRYYRRTARVQPHRSARGQNKLEVPRSASVCWTRLGDGPLGPRHGPRANDFLRKVSGPPARLGAGRSLARCQRSVPSVEQSVQSVSDRSPIDPRPTDAVRLRTTRPQKSDPGRFSEVLTPRTGSVPLPMQDR